MLRESCLSRASGVVISRHWPTPGIGSKIRLPSSYIYYSSYITGQWVGGIAKSKGVFREWVDACCRFFFACCFSSLYHIFCNCVFWFRCCSWGEFTCFSYRPLVRFVFDALHSSSYCLLSCLFWCFAIDLLLVARWLFLLYVWFYQGRSFPEVVILVGFSWAICPRLLGITQVVLHIPFHTFGRLIEFKPRFW